MERQLWRSILAAFREIGKPRFDPRSTFTVIEVVRVWFWAVIHDRPISWACERENWPIHERRQRLPSNATMSRRMRSHDVRAFLKEVEDRVLRPNSAACDTWFIDGKPLAISGCSKDRQATYGRATGGKAKGYKLHLIFGKNGMIGDWRMASMKDDEREMARRILRTTTIQGRLVADGNYDSNKLFAICDERGDIELIAPRRYGPDKGFGHRPQTAGRLRSKEILEDSDPQIAQQIMDERVAIERFFGNLTNWGGGLACLPAWARTYRRVRRWVQAKLILNGLKRRRTKRT
ncbi:transposase [Blastopirellula sp. JC732]|uniref:Transposase n=1 Tax=Blastopirellula sediminis TaxID=2894196 RepID=A0A9X1SIZ8_9BACT|nr:transposase [Blastopirellula sediminis]MCC9604558.1 transposase [Blastopirellula sediminis]MCC9632143.1 transposase [Blastopirellula sediminis]